MKTRPRWVWMGAFLAATIARAIPGDPPSTTMHFRFRTPRQAAYRVVPSNSRAQWVRAWPEHEGTNFVELGSRVVLQLAPDMDLNRLLGARSLTLARVVTTNVFVLQAPDAMTAASEADRLAALQGVLASYPVSRRPVALHGAYAPQPKDSLFEEQWPLEHRNPDGSSAGVDLNVRAAWPATMGEGVTVAVADTGIELTHPELLSRVVGAPHYNFVAESTNAGPIDGSSIAAHATEVAGLIAADINHARMAGVAPGANLASWVVFDTNIFLATDEQMMDAYQYQSNIVSVQNHSWGFSGLAQNLPPLLEQIGISNAITYGRFGKGVIMVRSAGNDRTSGANANDDGYPSDPHVIAVAAVRIDGRVASYSEPGACILVGAPSGDTDLDGLFTTDLLGNRGANQLSFFPPNEDLSDYVFNFFGFNGTSAAAPHIAGIAALLLSANPNLTYRDVQQILILSSRHFDLADPDVLPNGVGLLVSHNLGFGIPDAGLAVRLAKEWQNRPQPITRIFTATNIQVIPDDGLRLVAKAKNLPEALKSIRTLPDVGPQADEPTPTIPLAYVGFATNPISLSLSNRAALIQRGGATFADKINRAAAAGALFAVVYNYATNLDNPDPSGGDQLIAMGGTDFVPIPAVFIGNTDGEALRSYAEANNHLVAQIRLKTVSYSFKVADTLLCEHVGVRVQTDHQSRSDVRITLVSPTGTRSVLQRYNLDTNPGPVDWTYYSTHHFFEPSAGTWTVYFGDESAGATGSVKLVSLVIDGVPIRDKDHDGLDDNWERTHFHGLKQGPQDDPDHDGYSNAIEQILGTDPALPSHVPFEVDLSRWNDTRLRLSWPASPAARYEIWSGTNAASLSLLTNVPGHFPEGEWFLPCNTFQPCFFRVRALPSF